MAHCCIVSSFGSTQDFGLRKAILIFANMTLFELSLGELSKASC